MTNLCKNIIKDSRLLLLFLLLFKIKYNPIKRKRKREYPIKEISTMTIMISYDYYDDNNNNNILEIDKKFEIKRQK